MAKFKDGGRIRANGTRAPVGTVVGVRVRAVPSGVAGVADALPDEFVSIAWDGLDSPGPWLHASHFEHAT